MYDDGEKLGTEGKFEKSLISYDILDKDGNWDEAANIAEAKIAKEKGVFVIGISSEPKILQSENIDILLKKPYDVYELWEAIIT
jgi:hypothetical protein